MSISSMQGPENVSQTARIPELDGVRGVAIGMILLYHYIYLAAALPSNGLLRHYWAPLRPAWTGVDLFFVLSGYLIGGILLDSRGSPNYFKTFYVRRFCRIAPLYAVVLCACLLFALALQHGFATHFAWMLDGRLPWFSYIFYLQNIWMARGNTLGMPGLDVTWSLAVEEQFYLTLPLLVWWLAPRRLYKVVLALTLAAPVIRSTLYLASPETPLLSYILTPCRMDALLLGVLAAMAMRSPAARIWIETHNRLIVGAMLVLLLAFASMHRSLNSGSPFMRTVGFSLVALFDALFLVHALTWKSSPLSRALRWGFLRWLGRIAYGVYLLHYLVLLFLTGWIAPGYGHLAAWPVLDSWLQFVITAAALCVTLALCTLSWQCFEQPLVKLGHRYKYRDNAAWPLSAPTYQVAPR